MLTLCKAHTSCLKSCSGGLLSSEGKQRRRRSEREERQGGGHWEKGHEGETAVRMNCMREQLKKKKAFLPKWLSIQYSYPAFLKVDHLL